MPPKDADSLHRVQSLIRHNMKFSSNKEGFFAAKDVNFVLQHLRPQQMFC